MAIKKNDIIEQAVKHANKMLALPLRQCDKAEICCYIEDLLHRAGRYAGFNYLYWMDEGGKQWEGDNRPKFPKKYEYIYGKESVKDIEELREQGKFPHDSVKTWEKQGELSRYYFIKSK